MSLNRSKTHFFKIHLENYSINSKFEK
uniref:Uncharacterized protein n=1 Tax=Heterorhabditis bacteriophora TaxID=37862 RepID=A0A1I7WKM7_HETBA